MQHLSRTELLSLEQYAEQRPAFRNQVMAHKKVRQVALGDHATLYFEDRMTIQYQIQEMLRVERIFEAAGIEEELAAYNPLIPDGSNWKATFMLEYPEVEQRREQLAQLQGIEQAIYIEVAGHGRVTPIANEDLDRTTSEKTSSVHFMRFELTAEMIAALRAGAALAMGIDHPNYQQRVDQVEAAVRDSLIADLD